jgi:hypothetical protein
LRLFTTGPVRMRLQRSRERAMMLSNYLGKICHKSPDLPTWSRPNWVIVLTVSVHKMYLMYSFKCGSQAMHVQKQSAAAIPLRRKPTGTVRFDRHDKPVVLLADHESKEEVLLYTLMARAFDAVERPEPLLAVQAIKI